MKMHLFDDKKTEDLNLPEKVLESAHERAEKIIENALNKSEEIIKDMEQFRNQMQKELRPIFKQSSDSFVHTLTEQSKEFAAACDELIPQIKEKYIKNVDASIAGFKVELSKELIPVRELVDKQVGEVVVELKKRVDDEWKSAHAEIESYKEQRKQQLERQVEEQIVILAKEAFGKSLSATEQQQLVMNALEKAKQEGVFNS